jgi:hypothetical protein
MGKDSEEIWGRCFGTWDVVYNWQFMANVIRVVEGKLKSE